MMPLDLLILVELGELGLHQSPYNVRTYLLRSLRQAVWNPPRRELVFW